VAPKLQPGERVIYEGHPSWRSIVGFYLKGLALTTVVALIVAAATSLTSDGANAGLVLLVALAGVALTVLVGFVKRVATSYTVTDRRLHIRSGIVARTVQETRIHRVQNVHYRQTLLQRVLGVGDVDFDTATGHDYSFTFTGVATPSQVVQLVNQATPTSHHP